MMTRRDLGLYIFIFIETATLITLPQGCDVKGEHWQFCLNFIWGMAVDTMHAALYGMDDMHACHSDMSCSATVGFLPIKQATKMTCYSKTYKLSWNALQ